jgi:hypothetical protein
MMGSTVDGAATVIGDEIEARPIAPRFRGTLK